MATKPLERAIATYADYAPARGLLAFCLLFAVHMAWIERDRAVVPIASTPLGLLPLAIAITGGTRSRLLGHDGAPDRRINLCVLPSCRLQPELGNGSLSSQSRVCLCRARSGSHRARRGGYQAQSS